MPKLSCFVSLLLLSFIGYSQFAIDASQIEPFNELQGKVKSYTEIEADVYFFQNPSEDYPPLYQTEMDFNESGQVIKMVDSSFRADSSLHSYYGGTFNQDGYLDFIRIFEDGVELSFSVIAEISQNSVISKYFNENEELERITTEMKDKEDNIIYQDIYEPKTGEKYITTYSYKYDAQKRITKKLVYEDGELMLKYNYSYNGYEETSILKNAEDELYSHTITTKNSDGLIVSEKELDDEGNIDSVEWYEYNDRGEVIKITNKGPFGMINTTLVEYQYDDQGNWVSKTEIEDSDLSVYTLRQIEYY